MFLDSAAIAVSRAYGEFAALADAKQTRKILEEHGLKSRSAHFTLGELRTMEEPAIAWAHEIGMTRWRRA